MSGMNTQRITLIGFMGVGKTTVGKSLARKLNYQFIDIDQKIEHQFNMKTTDIFKVHGEATFRKAERELTLSYLKKNQIVLSLGGGAFLQDEIKKSCLKQSTVASLHISWNTWRKRLNFLKHKRPLLQNKSINEIHNLFNERRKYYLHYHLKVNCDYLSANKIADEIIRQLKTDKV